MSLTKEFTATVTGSVGYNLRLKSNEIGNISVNLLELNLSDAEMDALEDAFEVKGEYINKSLNTSSNDIAAMPGRPGYKEDEATIPALNNSEYEIVFIEPVTP